VDDAVLDRVYRFDLALLAGVEEARESAQAAGAAAGGVGPALETFIARVDALDAALGEREQILSGVR
jgi:hypothetical protein